MLNDSLISQRLKQVTNSLEEQFAFWSRDKEISQSALSLPLNEFVIELKQEADQVIAAIEKNVRHDMHWDTLQTKWSQLISHGQDTRDATAMKDIDVAGHETLNDDIVTVPNVSTDIGFEHGVNESQATNADKYLFDIILQYMDILQFYYDMQLSMDHYHALVQARDYYSKLRGSVWKYTVIPFQFWKHGFQVSTLRTMFTAKTLKVNDLVNAADILATPTRLVNFQLDDVSKKLTSEIDSLLVSTGEELSRFVNKTYDENDGGKKADTESTLKDVSLDKIMSRLNAVSHLQFTIPEDVRIPPWYQRQWFQLSVLSIYGPMLLKKLVQNGQSLWTTVSQGSYEFVSGLWENWIWTPITQIWDTVRFDSGELYVTTKDNLTSELNSLIRMIVEFLRDRSPPGTNVDVDSLTKQIMDGDLQDFMKIYEHQIENPVKSIVFDNMVRSLLIQLQKVKVDGSMAMNGINKLLKSQQLLFSIVSLLPALLIIWALRNFLSHSISSGVEWAKDLEGTKFTINRSLNEIERLLNVPLSEEVIPHDEQMKSLALLNLEVATLKMVMVKYLPKNYKPIWVRDCNDLGDYGSTNEAKINVINRIHHMYGKFM